MNASKILVVEDNPLTRKMLRLALQAEGYTVIEAPDGQTALEAAQRELPALVLQDLVLPDMSGFELVERLRALCGAATPIVALSGFASRLGEARGAEAGFSAVLLKPIEPARLVEVVRCYLPEAPASQRTGTGRRVLVVDDDLVQLKLARLQLSQLGFEVAAAASAKDALALARSSPPDVIYSDVLMPGTDGFQLCFEIRQDATLARIPVVLSSAWYETPSDRELAARVGASALVLKTPELEGVAEALLEAIRRGPPPAAGEPDLRARLQHARAVIGQLERQVTLSRDLARRCALQAAQISLLGGVAHALALDADADAALHDVLAATLDAAGISKGALLLRAPDGALRLRHVLGLSRMEADAVERFFRSGPALADVMPQKGTLSLPSPFLPEPLGGELLRALDATTAHIVPLVSEGRSLGAMLLCAKHGDVTREDSIAFSRAMGNQLAQSLGLAQTFARLTASERRYRAVTEAAHDAIAILTSDGVIVEVNASCEALLGLPREQIAGKRLEHFAAPGNGDGGGDVLSNEQGLQTSRGASPSLRPLRRSDGSTVLVEFTGRAVDLGKESVVVAIGRDVTERVETQTQLMFSDRMASIGALAAGVAHEINNPLMATIANLEFALEHLDGLGSFEAGDARAMLTDFLRDAAEGAARVRAIVGDLKIFSRAEEERAGPVDVQRVLESSLRMAWNELRHRAELVREYQPVPPVLANESRLGQVFLNLIMNAVQALPDGYADRHQIRVRCGLAGDGRVRADVEDTGPGIPPEILSRLFTPFFTTKPRGVGTGLGLSISKRIVDSFGGEIAVDSAVGRGTTFRVLLPAAPAQPVAEPPPSTGPVAAPAPRARILVIDDDPLSAAVVSRSLSAHEITITNDADDALTRIAAAPDAFDVILCDLMMPVKTGVEFFVELTQRAPELAPRVIFLTGGAFSVKAREFIDRVPNPCLEKPFEIDALRKLVHDRLIEGGRHPTPG